MEGFWTDMLRMRFDQISGPSVRIRVGFDYTITGGEGTPFFDQVEQVVDRVLDRQFHGGAPDLLPMIWDAIKERDRLYGLRMDATWMHVGTPGDLEEAERFLRDL